MQTVIELNQLPQPAVFKADYFRMFLDYTDRTETTVKGYLSCLRRFSEWMADNSITEPTRADIKAYKAFLAASDLKAGTQQQYIRAVKHLFRWLAAEGLYTDIAANIHAPKLAEGHRRDAFDREAVLRIAETVDRSTPGGKRLYAMFLLALTCGLRTVEISRANIQDIKTTAGKTYLYVTGKGHTEPDAPALLVPEVKKALADYLETRTDTGGKSKTPLFVSTSPRNPGERILPRTISGMFKELFRSAGYDSDRLTAHSLRHASNTAAFKATGDLYLTQLHARHTDPKTTEIYIHAEDRDQRTTEQSVYNYFFGGNNGSNNTGA